MNGTEPAPVRAALNRSEVFIQERKESWTRFSAMVDKAKNSPKRLSPEDLKEFPRLYRRTCADLARARSLGLANDLIDYLNESVARAHTLLYAPPPLDRSGIARFFLDTLPDAVIRNFPAVALSALLFFGSYAISLTLVSRNGDLGPAFVPAEVLDSFTDSYRQEIDGRSLGGSSYMTAFYIRNNVSIAFLSFATGILAGAGAVYFLIYNGLYLGTVEGYIKFSGFGANLDAFTMAHGPLELSGLVLAGAAGLCLGYAVIRGGRYRRADALLMARAKIFPLVAAFVACIGSAAFIEGFVSPHALPLWIKAGIAWLSAACLFAYFLAYPLLRRFLSWRRRG
jgi:uncharacterized membrane protein SpoIIM required for sporulation